jgi:hypothetical protein
VGQKHLKNVELNPQSSGKFSQNKLIRNTFKKHREGIKEEKGVFGAKEFFFG